MRSLTFWAKNSPDQSTKCQRHSVYIKFVSSHCFIMPFIVLWSVKWGFLFLLWCFLLFFKVTSIVRYTMTLIQGPVHQLCLEGKCSVGLSVGTMCPVVLSKSHCLLPYSLLPHLDEAECWNRKRKQGSLDREYVLFTGLHLLYTLPLQLLPGWIYDLSNMPVSLDQWLTQSFNTCLFPFKS